jgi:outer membrane protein TolC
MKLYLLIFFSTLPAVAATLSLEDYLGRVAGDNSGVLASEKIAEASEGGKAQSYLLTAPSFFAEARSTEDKSPTLLGELQGTYRKNQTFTTGLQFRSLYGFNGRAFIAGEQQGIFGSSFIEPGKNEVYFQSSNLEVSVPLWQGFMGNTVRLERDRILTSAQAEKSLAEFEKQGTLIEAELSYLRLAKLHREIEVIEELVRQGERLVSFSRQKVSQRLLEITNLKESEAALSARRLELEARRAEKRDAEKVFQSFLEAESLTEIELEPLERLFEKSKILERIPVRKDLEAQALALESDQAVLSATDESLKPRLDLSARAATFNQQSNFNDSQRCRSANDCSLYSVGVYLEVPLDRESVSKSRAAIAGRLKARELTFKRVEYDSGIEFKRLHQQLELTRKQIGFAEDLVKIQNERLREERKRQTFGRGSTFDVIRSEQDHSQSILNDLQIRYAYLEAATRLKSFAEKKP